MYDLDNISALIRYHDADSGILKGIFLLLNYCS